jgi:dUTP pyrophosphatase
MPERDGPLTTVVRQLEEKLAALRTAKVRRDKPNAQIPYRHYEGDAGFDLAYCGVDPIDIYPGCVADVPCGVAVEWPNLGTWGFLVGRSSSFRNRGMLVNPAIIDNGFRGELFAIVRNVGLELVAVMPGERVAQVIPMPLMAKGMLMAEAEELSPSDRDVNGFGSTGL